MLTNSRKVFSCFYDLEYRRLDEVLGLVVMTIFLWRIPISISFLYNYNMEFLDYLVSKRFEVFKGIIEERRK